MAVNLNLKQLVGGKHKTLGNLKRIECKEGLIWGGVQYDLIISTVDELKAFRDKVTHERDTFKNKLVYLASDLDLSEELWTPIGRADVDETGYVSARIPFAGNFDGGGHSISGLFFDGDAEQSLGLFGMIEDGATVKNLFVNGGFYSDSARCAGMIAGVCYGSIVNCGSSGSVSLNSEASWAGGIAGMGAMSVTTLASIRDCFSLVDVNARGFAGGILGGGKNVDILRCVSVSNYIESQDGKCGGIAGELYRCSNSVGAVNSLNGGTTAIGRVVSGGGILLNNHAWSKSYVNGNIVIGGEINNKDGASVTKTELNFQSFYEGLGFDFSVWKMSHREGDYQGYPILRFVKERESPDVVIGTREDFANFAMQLLAGDRFSGKRVSIAADIDISGIELGVQATEFDGDLSGNGHVLSGLSNPLFGTLRGTVNDLNLSGALLGSEVGFFASRLEGYLRACFAEGSISGGSVIGGLVGSMSSGGIRDCFSYVSIEGISQLGGIVGDVAGGDIERCVAMGLITGTGVVGGIGTASGSGVYLSSCAALMYELKGGVDTVSRIAYGVSATPTLSRCYGLKTLLVNGRAVSSSSASGSDGADMTLAEARDYDFCSSNLDIYFDYTDWDLALWKMSDPMGVYAGFLILTTMQDPAGAADIVIATVEDLEDFRINMTDPYEGPYANKNIVLANDIEWNREWATPTSQRGFTGVFDGRGYTIKGLQTTTGNQGGFIGINRGVIRNLHVTVECSDVKFFGGIAVQNKGLIDRCSVVGTVSTANTTGVVVGGIVGLATASSSYPSMVLDSFSDVVVTDNNSDSIIAGVVASSTSSKVVKSIAIGAITTLSSKVLSGICNNKKSGILKNSVALMDYLSGVNVPVEKLARIVANIDSVEPVIESCYALRGMLLNSSEVEGGNSRSAQGSSIYPGDELKYTFYSEELYFDFVYAWKMSNPGGVFKGYPVLREMKE